MRRRIIKNRNLKDYSCFTGAKTAGHGHELCGY